MPHRQPFARHTVKTCAQLTPMARHRAAFPQEELADGTRSPVGPAKIALLGAGELHLPAPQRAEAKSSSPNTVTMTLYCASDDTGADVKPISIQLAPAMARALAIRLWLAADDSDDPAK